MMRTLAAILAFATVAYGADLTGTWVGQIERPNNVPLDVAFQLVQTGATLKGKLYGDYGSTAITEGKLDGDTISFIVVTSEQAGNEINEVRLSYTGALKDATLELTRERISSRNSGNKGEGRIQKPTNSAKQVVVLKRLL